MSDRQVPINLMAVFKTASALVLLKVGILLAAFCWVLHQGVVPNLCTWDCEYYRQIANGGYTYVPGHQGNLAFFPLVPLLIRVVQHIVPPLPFEALAIGWNLLMFGLGVGLFLFWSWRVNRRLAILGAVLFACDRYTLWSQAPYTEATFFVIVLAALNIDRLEWPPTVRCLAVASLGGLASACRIVGVSVVGALGLSRPRFFIRRFGLAAVCLALGLAGTALFFAYLQLKFGSWTRSLETTSTWGRHFDIPSFFKSGFFLIKSFYFPTVVVLGISGYTLIINSGRRFSAFERLLFALLIFIPMASTLPVSLTRYLSLLPIAYLVVDGRIHAWLSASRSQPKIWLIRLAIAAFVVSEIGWQILLTAKFFRGEVFNWAS